MLPKFPSSIPPFYLIGAGLTLIVAAVLLLTWEQIITIEWTRGKLLLGSIFIAMVTVAIALALRNKVDLAVFIVILGGLLSVSLLVGAVFQALNDWSGWLKDQTISSPYNVVPVVQNGWELRYDRIC